VARLLALLVLISRRPCRRQRPAASSQAVTVSLSPEGTDHRARSILPCAHPLLLVTMPACLSEVSRRCEALKTEGGIPV